MNDRNNSPGCERASDLIAFLYDEVSEREARDFQLHLDQCAVCHEEAVAFGAVRESITAWRDEALPHFVPSAVTPQLKTKSAVAALRQFFDLSPLWLKGATAFALLVFFGLAGFVIFRNNENPTSHQVVTNATYTQGDVDRLVKEALAKQQPPAQTVTAPEKTVAVESGIKTPGKRSSAGTNQFARSRRPLSRAEREQLAADLRLLAADDDAPVQLLGDRINQ